MNEEEKGRDVWEAKAGPGIAALSSEAQGEDHRGRLLGD